jgi:hypothetical protein
MELGTSNPKRAPRDQQCSIEQVPCALAYTGPEHEQAGYRDEVSGPPHVTVKLTIGCSRQGHEQSSLQASRGRIA